LESVPGLFSLISRAEEGDYFRRLSPSCCAALEFSTPLKHVAERKLNSVDRIRGFQWDDIRMNSCRNFVKKSGRMLWEGDNGEGESEGETRIKIM
jgi:hypothetical protein